MIAHFFNRSSLKGEWKMFLELLGQIPPCFLIKFLLDMKGNWSENFVDEFFYISFAYQVLIQYDRKLIRKLPGRIPLHFFIKPLLKVHGNTHGAPWINSLTLLS